MNGPVLTNDDHKNYQLNYQPSERRGKKSSDGYQQRKFILRDCFFIFKKSAQKVSGEK
jgi:hypothetical protein